MYCSILPSRLRSGAPHQSPPLSLSTLSVLLNHRTASARELLFIAVFRPRSASLDAVVEAGVRTRAVRIYLSPPRCWFLVPTRSPGRSAGAVSQCAVSQCAISQCAACANVPIRWLSCCMVRATAQHGEPSMGSPAWGV